MLRLIFILTLVLVGLQPDGYAYDGHITIAAETKVARELVDLTEHRAPHILDRHAAGKGISGKSEFPASWSDKEILHNVSDVGTDPSAVTGVGKWNSPYSVGTRDGVQIRVDFYPPNHPTYSGKIPKRS